ncbi:hypothetical protein B0H15DRAFT_800822 [Mycena belliarum]|uniref:Uncharacterized protein n=1 Tax=Mycena belliarum TaxID=1033014 RepID=A0AAD6U531_9AGAR|nr:hypothetical protein B0H15DRAFT_800822 [Mycena belliae]
MSVLSTTTVASAISLDATFPQGFQVNVKRGMSTGTDRGLQRYKALLFATGEAAPFIVDIAKPPVTMPGAALGGLAYMPWLTGSATSGPPNHSSLEVAVYIEGGDPAYMTVVIVDQNHPPHLVFPKNLCMESAAGGGLSWKGNVLAVRRVGGQLADVKLEHIVPIIQSVGVYDCVLRFRAHLDDFYRLIRGEVLGAESAMFVVPATDVHTDSE